MDANQLGRRNLTPDQRSIMRGRRYNRTKKAAHDGGKGKTRVVDTLSATNTAESLAAEHHVSEKTIRRDGKRAEALDKLAETQPEQAQAVRDGGKGRSRVDAEVAPTNTAAALAKAHGVSERTIKSDGKRAEDRLT